MEKRHEAHRDTTSSRRAFLQSAGVGALTLALGCKTLGTGLPTSSRKKPNVVVILSDDHGYGAMGCMGNWNIPTPNIDSIAKNGVCFTNGYVTCPICSPTRAGLLTGRYQQRFGHEDNPGPIPVASPNFGLPLSEKTLADYMKAEGYATGIVGKWHLGHRPELHPQKRGFDEFFGFLTGAHSYLDPGLDTNDPILRGTEKTDEKEYLTDALGREAVSFIDRHKEQPFFLYLPFNAVHVPLDAPPKYKDSFSEFKDRKARIWAAQLKSMDDAIGEVLSKIRKSGLENDTLIFFLGDNGGYPVGSISPNAPLHGRKTDVYEGGVRIPFLIQWKGAIPSGKVYDKPVVSLDILPTALTAVGGEPASNIEGVDLLPHVKGENSGTPHDRLFWRICDRSAARVGNWKLVRNGDGAERLFDLSSDIGEKNDLAATHPDKLKELQDAYNEWDAKNIPPKWIDGRKGAGKE